MAVATKFAKQVDIHKYKLDDEGNVVLDENDEPAYELCPDGTKYVERRIGCFTFKRPTVADEVEIGVAMAQKLHGLRSDQVDPFTAFRARVLATLSFVIIESPEGWKLKDVVDSEELAAIHKEYLEGLKKI